MNRRQMKQAAYDYAQFDRTDPFSYSRAISHINNGLCDRVQRGDELVDAHYKAEPTAEKHILPATGEEYNVLRHKNVSRP